MQKADFLIVGAGIAGASAGYFLSAHGRVLVLEAEGAPGYHSTGRSAAFYAPSYGGKNLRPLTLASRAFLDDPPGGFGDEPLLRERGALYIGREDQLPAIEKFYQELRLSISDAQRWSAEEARAACPGLRDGYVAGAVFEPQCLDIDVNALHSGYLRGIRANGGAVLTSTDVTSLRRDGDLWQAGTIQGDFAAPILVNAAGAWGDVLAGLADIRAIGLQPMRRTIVIMPPPQDMSDDWPLVLDVDDEFYFKPESGRLLASPGDESPVEPCDVQPEEIDIAITIDRIQKAVHMDAPKIENSWAGLRTFSRDRTPVVGFDPDHEGFFWLVGQGGYGIKTSPALGRLGEALITNGEMPEAFDEFGVDAATYSPARFRADHR